MIKTILAFLIIGAPIAYIIHAMATYPILMWAGIWLGGSVVFMCALAWAGNYLSSKFSNNRQ